MSRFKANHHNSNRNQDLDSIEMNNIPEPEADYDDEEPDLVRGREVDRDSYEDYSQLGLEDGLDRTADESGSVQVRNRFRSNGSIPRNQLSADQSMMTMRQARRMAEQLGILNEEHERNLRFDNDGFEAEDGISIEGEDRRTYDIEPNYQRRECWAKSCRQVSCKIHSFFKDMSTDEEQINEHHYFYRKYQAEINQVEDRLSEFWSMLKIWSKDLRKIEAFYGTGIVSYFHFLRWLLFINILISLSVVLLIIVPQYSPGNASSNETSSNKTSNSTVENGAAYQIVLDLLQGTGFLSDSFVFIGYYERKELPLFNWSYNMPLAYIACTIFYFLFCFILMLRYTTDGMRDTLLSEHHQQYSSMIFCGWDFFIQKEERLRLKQKSIAMEVQNCQEVDLRRERASGRSPKEKVKLFMIRFAIFMVVVALLGGSFYAIFKVTDLSINYKSEDYRAIMELIIEFSPNLVIFALYTILPEVFLWLIKYEKYDSPETVIKITLMRMVFLRLSSVIVLLISLFITIKNKGNQSECWENYVGQSFYKLMIGDLILELVVIFIWDSFRKVIVRKNLLHMRKILDYQRFDIAKNVLSLVYIQAICWLGTFYCPLLPVICVFRLVLLFYAQKFTLLKNCSPPDQAYRASRSNIIFILILIISYFISAMAVAYSVTSSTIPKSGEFTPFRGYGYKWQPFDEFIKGSPVWVGQAYDILISGASTLVISFFLCLLMYSYYVRGLIHKKMIKAVHSELKEIANDRIYLISQLSISQIRQGLRIPSIQA